MVLKNIRHKVFETNSSSTHSISISKDSDGILETLEVSEDGVVSLTGGQFGWEWAKYNDARTKANYAGILVRDNEALKSFLIKTIKNHTGAKEVRFDFSLDFNANYEDWSYIDHQSGLYENGDALKVFENEQTLKNWIFNPKSWLFTGNDNEYEPPNFRDVDETNYKFELIIEGLYETYKFKEKPDEEQIKEALEVLFYRTKVDYSNREGFEEIFISESWPDDFNGQERHSFESLDQNEVVMFVVKEDYGKNDYKRILKSEIRYSFELKEL